MRGSGVRSAAACEHELHVQARVDLRVPFLGLRHAIERVEFRENPRERAAIAKRAQPGLRRGLGQSAIGFLPDALRDECVRFAGGDHRAHARHGFRRDRESERLEARQEPRDAQDADRVFVEGFGHVSELTRFEIDAAAVRIDDARRSRRAPSH